MLNNQLKVENNIKEGAEKMLQMPLTVSESSEFGHAVHISRRTLCVSKWNPNSRLPRLRSATLASLSSPVCWPSADPLMLSLIFSSQIPEERGEGVKRGGGFLDLLSRPQIE